MYRLTEQEINLETAELDSAAHHPHAIGRIPDPGWTGGNGLQGSVHTPEDGGLLLESSSSSSSLADDEEQGEVRTLVAGNTPRSEARTPASRKAPNWDQRIGKMEIEGVEAGETREPGDDMDPVMRASLISMYSLQNSALLMSYWTIGFAMTFTGTPLTAYAVNKLNVGPAQLNIAGTMLALPWSFKVLYGLLSDCVPIMGKRRKPYFVIGWSAFVAMNLGLASLGEPSLNALIGMGFFSVCGYMLADVMCDAIIVERSKLEPEGRVGHMQSVGYVARYVGNVVGATLGTILYNEKEWHWGLSISSIYLLNGLAAVVLVLPFTYHLSDPNQVLEARSLKEQLGDIWKMVQRRTIYVPMSFIAVYNMLLIPNAAWSNFLILGLKFTPWMLGIMFIVATVFSWLGITFYRAFLMPYSWRWVYIISTSLTVFFSVLQLSLIFRLNARWGIPDLIFALGDDAAANFITALQFLPAVTMYIGLCPAGAEGTSYAMLTTLSNVAGAIGSDLGTLMTGIWDVSNTALAAGEWTGLWKLSLLTSLLQPLGLCLLFLLPRDVAHQKAMQKCDKRDWWGGFGFVTVLVVAWTWTIVQTLVYLTTGSSV